jgi:capsular polysaccharide biosynthesis protein
VELSDGFVRVIGRHRWLIVILTACGLIGAAALHVGDAKQYRASVRFAMDTQDPSTSAQSTAIADTARALATSPALVADAVRKVGASRNAVQLAQHDVTVSSLGSSGVLAVTVSDVDPGVAQSLAQQIANEVIAQHARVINGRYDDTMKSLNTQIADTQRAIASTDLEIKLTGTNYDGPGRLGTPPLSERPWTLPEQLLRQRADLVQTLGALTAERGNVSVDRASRAQGTVIDAGSPAHRVAGRLVPDAALGGLLGLVVGIGIAALLEMFRPTLVGRDALARNLGAPVLAELQSVASAEGDIAEAAMHIELAAVAAGVNRVGLLAMRPAQDLRSLADLLGPAVRGLDVSVIARSGGFGAFDGVGAAGNDAGSSNGRQPGRKDEAVAAPDGVRTTMGVVLVTPRVVRVTELNRIVEFFTISGWPLLGLIVVRGRRPSPARMLSASTVSEAPLHGAHR